MRERIDLPVEFSIIDPNDPTEVTLVADAVSVGVTGPTKEGRVVRFTEDFLSKYAGSLRGKPVNVELSGDGPTGHSISVVGTIMHSHFDRTIGKIRIFAALWRHYYPATVEELINFHKDGKLQVSAELGVSDGDIDADGVLTPTQGSFTGLGIVRQGADFGNRVLILAEAMNADTEALNRVTTTADIPAQMNILPNSYEWAGNQIADYLANNTSDATVTGTYDDRFYYSADDSLFEVKFSHVEDGLSFGEPVQVTESDVTFYATDTGGQHMATETEIAEIKASLQAAETSATDYKEKFEALEAKIEAERAVAARDAIAATRLSEIEKIAPYTDEALKLEHAEIFKTADDKTFNALKMLLLAAAEPKGGIAPDASVPPVEDSDDPGAKEAEANLPKWREELLAQFGNAPSK